MHLLTEQTVAIGCPIDVAYAYATNLENFGQWFPGVVAIESGNNFAHSVPGKEYLETVSLPLRGKRKVTIVVKEAHLNKLLVTEGSLAPLMPRMEIRFESAEANSCQVTWRMLSRSTNLLTRAIIVPLAKNILNARAAKGLANLRSHLEAK